VSKVTEKIKTRSKPTPSENFNSHPLQNCELCGNTGVPKVPPFMGKILNIYFNKIIFVEVYDCCVTSQAHQNGCLGIQ
jgi:hypothetical protein